MSSLSLQNIINKRFALRALLANEAYHISETSVPKTELTEEKEPNIRETLKAIAAKIVESPDSILLDTYDLAERRKDWAALQKKEVLSEGQILSIDTRSRSGHKILDHHMRHFFDVKNWCGVSVRSLVNQEQMEKALLANLSMHSTPYKSELRRMLTMTAGLGNVTKYRTITSKAIVEFFQAKRIVDPCTGWGGRLLGTLAAGDTKYVGCEPDPKTAEALRQILADPAISATIRARGQIIEKPAEVALLEIAQMPKFDMILTSPPYFNLEIYTAGEQSISKWPTWDLWISEWYKPLILGYLTCLKEGGVSCWSVKNFKTDKKYLLADVTKKIHKDAGWDLIKTVVMTGSGRPGGKRIVEGKETRESEEETFCFKRSI